MLRRRLAGLAALTGLLVGTQLVGTPAATAEQPPGADVVEPAAQAPADEVAEILDIPNQRLHNVRHDSRCMRATAPRAGATVELHSGSGDEDECDGGTDEVWEFDVRRSEGGVPIFQIRHPVASPDLCLSLDGVESGPTPSGTDAQLEPCENQHDALWYIWRLDGSATHLRNWDGAHADRCLQGEGNGVVQVITCDANFNGQRWRQELA